MWRIIIFSLLFLSFVNSQYDQNKRRAKHKYHYKGDKNYRYNEYDTKYSQYPSINLESKPQNSENVRGSSLQQINNNRRPGHVVRLGYVVPGTQVLADQKMDAENCMCVPEYLCDNYYNIKQAGEGILSERIGQPTTSCANILEVCCLLKSVVGQMPVNITEPGLPQVATTSGIVTTQITTLAPVATSPSTTLIPAVTTQITTVAPVVTTQSTTTAEAASTLTTTTSRPSTSTVTTTVGTTTAVINTTLTTQARPIPSAPPLPPATTTTPMATTTPTTRMTTPAMTQPQCGVSYASSANRELQTPENMYITAFTEFPWMLALLDSKALAPDGRSVNTAFICGASLLSKHIAMTAAHCIKGRPASTMLIRAGEWNTLYANETIPYQDRSLSRVIIHPAYNNLTLYNDVAILKLDQPVIYANNVQPICMPKAEDKFIGQNCIATGWGQNVFGANGRYATKMRKVELKILDRNECQTKLQKTRLGSFFILHDSFTCAEGNTDTCTGDGGGPLFCKVGNTYIQTGIVSWGIGCGQKDVPGVYVDVPSMKPWIDATMYSLLRDNLPK